MKTIPPRIFLGIILWLMWVMPAQAESDAVGSTITVNSHLDTSGNGSICTLRDAINAANSNAPAGGCPAGTPYPAMDSINIQLSRQFCLFNGCTIILSSPLPQVIEDVSIQGTGNWVPTISGNYAYRIFDLGGVVVNISNMNLIRGNATGSSTAGYGGAILTSTLGTTLSVTSVYFTENHASSRGGAIQVSAGITVVDQCTFIGNTVDYFGGAIGQFGGVLILTNSSLIGNSALDGGALDIQSSSDTRLTNVTISGNTATGRGGGISRIGTGPTMSMNNVTIANNIADLDKNTSGEGGGIYRGGGTVTLANTIIAGNFDTPGNAGPGVIQPDCSGTLTTFGYNLIGSGAGCGGLAHGANGDMVGTNSGPILALLNPLRYNGGVTMTHSLAPGSPALEAGNPLVPGGGGFGACAPVDQRNTSRPQGTRCDIGAYEGMQGMLFLPYIQR
jgi:CSLREA domain-containing protein